MMDQLWRNGFSKNVVFYVVNMVLIAPFSILVWRGLWELGQGLILLPQNCLFEDPGECTDHAALVGKVTFCVVGLVLRVLIEMTQRPLGDLLYGARMSILLTFKYVFITFNVIVSILLWSGSWALMDTAHIQIKDTYK